MKEINVLKGIQDLNILVVDDEPDLGELVAFEFELVGAKVQNSLNGREALEKIKQKSFDVVVSDIRMPGGDGVELLERLRAHNPKSPVLAFMTGFADISPEDAYDKGAVAMFGKPFNRKDLIHTVGMSVLPYDQRWPNETSSNPQSLLIESNHKSIIDAGKSGRLRFGRGGFFVAIDNKIPSQGEVIRFDFKFENEAFKSVAGEGLVRWVRRQESAQSPKGIGVEIKTITSTYRKEFFAYLDHLDIPSFIPKQ